MRREGDSCGELEMHPLLSQQLLAIPQLQLRATTWEAISLIRLSLHFMWATLEEEAVNTSPVGELAAHFWPQHKTNNPIC